MRGRLRSTDFDKYFGHVWRLILDLCQNRNLLMPHLPIEVLRADVVEIVDFGPWKGRILTISSGEHRLEKLFCFSTQQAVGMKEPS